MGRNYIMSWVYVAIMICNIVRSGYSNSKSSHPLPIITRDEWGGRPPTGGVPLDLPVPIVMIHHSSVPPACNTTEDCRVAMRHIQDAHQLMNGWTDIGYNFAVGGDGLVYEGRGWGVVGAHATGWNNRSIGIVLIGHWVSELPPAWQLRTTKNVIAAGVGLGYIAPEYSLVGHRQAVATYCPGDALFDEISTWIHFDPEPTLD